MKKNWVEKLNIFLAVFSYAFLIVLAVVSENTLFPHLSLLGGKASLCLVSVSCIGLFSDAPTGALFALLTGLSCDAMNSVGISLTPLFFIAVSLVYYFVGRSARRNRLFLSWLCFLPFLLFSSVIIGFISSILSFGGISDIVLLFKKELLPDLLCTTVFSIPFYFVSKFFDIPFSSVRNERGTNDK